MVVYLAFSKAVVEGLWQTFSLQRYRQSSSGSTSLLLAIVLALHHARQPPPTGFSRARPDHHHVLWIEESLASGVPMAGVIFAGQSDRRHRAAARCFSTKFS